MLLALSGWQMNEIAAPANEVIQITVQGKQNKTGDYLISYEEKMAETAKAGAAREASEQVIQIVIDALVQPDGTAIPDEFKPTAAELLKAHENPELLAAVEKVKQHAIGKLEEAEKN